MAKKIFTLDDIKNYLEELGFEWIDMLICRDGKYVRAKIKDFNKTVMLYLKNTINNQKHVMLATITNESFDLWLERNSINASADWQEYLAEQKSKKASI